MPIVNEVRVDCLNDPAVPAQIIPLTATAIGNHLGWTPRSPGVRHILDTIKKNGFVETETDRGFAARLIGVKQVRLTRIEFPHKEAPRKTYRGVESLFKL